MLPFIIVLRCYNKEARRKHGLRTDSRQFLGEDTVLGVVRHAVQVAHGNNEGGTRVFASGLRTHY